MARTLEIYSPLTKSAARQHDELKKEISALKGHVAQRDEVIQQHKRELNTASQDKRELLEVVEKRDKQLEMLTGTDTKERCIYR